jgi:hypothetical protein
LKRAYLILTILAIATTYLFFNNGCKKAPDTTPPLILLKGANPYYASLDTVYVDPGAIAQDNVDGNISSKIVVTGVSSVNTSKKGVFYINYSVTNSAGLSYSATRTVYVWNIADSLAGSFAAADSCNSSGVGAWADTCIIQTSNTVNGLMTFYNFTWPGDSAIGIFHYNDTITFNTPMYIGNNDSLISALGIVSIVDTSFTITGLPITSRIITLYYKWYNGISYDSCHAVF